MIIHKKYFLTEVEIKTSEAYKEFIELLMTTGSVLSSRVVDDVLFESALVEAAPGVSYTLVTTNSRIWALATAFHGKTDTTVLYAFNKDIVEELENGKE